MNGYNESSLKLGYTCPFASIVRVIILLPVFFLWSCSDSSEGEPLYFPYDPTVKEKTWMSLEEAMKRDKYDFLIEVSRFVGKKQTKKQKRLADELTRKTFEHAVARGWGDIEKAVADGYVYEPERDLTHLKHYEYLFDDEVLNPEKPEFLMYFNSEKGPVLAAVAYMLSGLEQSGPQIGGHETIWHFHSYPPACITNPYPSGHKLEKTLEQGPCEPGEVYVDRSAEMMHVWFLDHPHGRFASMMSIEADLLFKSAFAEHVNPAQTVMSKDHVLKGALQHHNH